MPAATLFNFKCLLSRSSIAILLALGLPLNAWSLGAQNVTITPSAPSVYPNQSVSFTAAGSMVGAYAYVWNGTGSTGPAQFIQSWSTPGSYTVTVQTVGGDQYDPSNVATATVTVLPPKPQVVTITSSPATVYPNQDVTLTASGSQVGIYAYNWQGTSATGINAVTQRWTAAGDYVVTVQASSNGTSYAASNVATATIHVLPPQTQTAAITSSPATVYPNQLVTLTATGSQVGIYAYNWQGASTTGINVVTQRWTTAGDYPVTVQISPNGTSYAASNVATATIHVLPPQAQTVAITPSSTSVYPNQPVTLTASGSQVGIYAYNWQGTSTTGINIVTQRWTTAGDYLVTVQVPSNGTSYAASNVATATIHVLPPQTQTVAITPSSISVYPNQTTTFTASGTQTGVYAWTGVQMWSSTTAHGNWTTPGSYTVSVAAPGNGTSYAQSDPVVSTVTVLPPQAQTVTISPSASTVYPGQIVTFTATGSLVGPYVWTGATLWTATTARIGWSEPGSYTVSVMAPGNGTSYAQSNLASTTVSVIPVPLQQPTPTLTGTTSVYVNQRATFGVSNVQTGASYQWSGATPDVPGGPTAHQSWGSPATQTVGVTALAYGNYAASAAATMAVTVISSTTVTGIPGAAKQSAFWGRWLDAIGGPVQLATGAEAFSRPLFHFNGARSWGFDVSYNSVQAASQNLPGPLGYGWTHPYETSVSVDGGNLTLRRDATHGNTFMPVTGSPGSYRCADLAAEYEVLTANSGGGWTLTRRDQSALLFDATGRLVGDRDQHGRLLTLAYNSTGQLGAVTEPISGTSLQFTYDAAGHLSRATDAMDLSVQFTYDSADAKGLLVGLTNQRNQCVSFVYDANHSLLTLTGNDGQVLTTNTYDSMGRVATQSDGVAGRAPLRFSYQQASLTGNIVTTATDKNGAVATYTFDSNYNLLSKVDPLGHSTSYTYDTAGNVLSQTDALGHAVSFTYDKTGNVVQASDEAGKVTAFSYDGRNNLLSATDPRGGVTTRTYDVNSNLLSLTDELGRTTTWGYDANSLPLTQTLPRGGVFSFAYAGGLVSAATDPAGVVVQFGYDANGRRLYRQDAQGHRTAYSYDAVGNLLADTDPLGHVTTRTYDARNRMLTLVAPDGGVSAFAYDNNNNLISKTDPLGQATAYAYDGEDRLRSVTDPLGHVTNVAYDAAGRRVSVTDSTGSAVQSQYDAAGHPTMVADGLGHQTTLGYDSRGRLTSSADPLARTSNFAYDDLGRRTAGADPLNHTTTMGYDALGHLTQSTDPSGLVTRQAFDFDGNRVSLTNASGNATGIAWGAAGRITAVTTPGGRVTSYAFDALGRPAGTTVPSGASTTTSYDAAGRVVGLADAAGAIAIGRDSNGRPLTTTENGQTLSRAYDLAGRVTRFTDGAGRALGYAYDAAGNLRTLTYPDGKTVTYTYDDANRLKTVTDWASRVTAYAYDAGGRLTRTVRPNGTTQSRTYDAAGQLTQLADLAPDSVTTLYSEGTGFDGAGRVTSSAITPMLPVPPAAATTASYDSDNRLLTFNGQATTFDANGNLLALPGGTPATFSYDARNRLVAAGALSYGYDAEGHRIMVTDTSGATALVVNPTPALDQVLVRTAPDGTVTRYVYGLGLAYEESGACVARYYHFSRRGDTVALSDATGSVTGRVVYGVYGEALTRTGQTDTAFLFNGLYGVQTDANGLYYHRARYFSPLLRRFVNQDSLLGDVRAAASLNRFAYANGNPVSLTDPFGLAAKDLAIGAANTLFGITQAPQNLVDEAGAYAATAIYDWDHFVSLESNLAGLKQQFGTREGLLSFGVSGVLLVAPELAVEGSALRAGLAGALRSRAGAAETTAARTGTELSTLRYTQPGESFIRYESPQLTTRITPGGGVTPGTFAAPISDGLVPVEFRTGVYNLYGPELRTDAYLLRPPPGTPIIGPRPVVGGTGNEVIFPNGHP